MMPALSDKLLLLPNEAKEQGVRSSPRVLLLANQRPLVAFHNTRSWQDAPLVSMALPMPGRTQRANLPPSPPS